MEIAGPNPSLWVLRPQAFAFAALLALAPVVPAAALDEPQADDVPCEEKYFGTTPGGVPGEREGPLLIAGNVRPPVRLHAPQPGYTDAAREARVEGVVILQTVIDEEGKVACAQILRGLPHGLSEAALAAVRQWRFQRALLDDEPRAVYFFLTVRFRLEPPEE